MPNSSKNTVLITGAAKRVGRDLALFFAKGGSDIIVHYNGSEQDAKNTQSDIEKLGVACELVQADLTNHQEIIHLLDHIKPPNILINNASTFKKSSFLETTEAILDEHMDIHFKAPFFLTQHFAKKVPSGHIINIIDTYITRETGAYFAYLLSKKMLASFTRMAANDLAPNIRVNAIALGLTEHNNNVNPDYVKTRLDRLPIGKEVTMLELYNSIEFLINTPSITGECIFLDNGDHLL